MAWWKNRSLVAAAVGLTLAGFGGGFLTARMADGFGPGRSSEGAPVEKAWGLFGKPRDADARRAGVPKPEGFAVWRSRVDTRAASPKACVEFSRPLDPAKDYADFVLVSPDLGRAPAVSVQGSELCLSGLGFFDRRVTLLKGLPGRGGLVLAANADVDFTFGEKPPYVGFAGDGVILPRDEADGVGIETVNVQRLAIEVWRVPDRNLVRRTISAPEPTPDGEWPQEWGDDTPQEEGRKVWSGQIAVRAPDGQRATTVFPLGAVLREMRPGAYVIKARDASGGRDLAEDPNEGLPAQARRWIVYTDMAITSYRGAEGLDAVVRSLKTARPMGGVRVALVARNGEDLAEGRTDAQGRVRFRRALLEGEGVGEAKMLMAYGPGDDFAAQDLDRSPIDLSRQGVGGRADSASGDGVLTDGRDAADVVDGFLYTDRGVYRPGETVRLVALLRDTEGAAVKDRKGVLVIRRPSGVEARRVAFERTPEGHAAADVALPATSPRGRWTVTLEIEGLTEPAGRTSFAVEDFAPQRLAVTMGGAERPVRQAGERRAIAVNARFLYGAAAAGLPVQGEARLRVDPEPFAALKDYRFGDETRAFEEKLLETPETVTDGDGRAILSVTPDAGEATQPLVARVTGRVFEPGGRPVAESVDLKVRTRPAYLGVKIDPGTIVGGRTPVAVFDLAAVNGEGARIATPRARWKLFAETWDYDWFQQDGRWQYRRSSRETLIAEGLVDVTARGARLSRRLEWGDYRFEIADEATGAKTVTRFAAGWGQASRGDDAPDLVRLSPVGNAYGQGDTVEIRIQSPFAGRAQIAVATDRVIEMRDVVVPEGGTTVRLRTGPAWGGGAYVLASVVQPRDPVASPQPRRALGLVWVPLDPRGRKLTVDLETPERTRGRDALRVPVRVQGASGKAKVTIAAVDQGVLNLTRFRSPDPVGWYFGKRALGVDLRDDYGRLLNPNLGPPANVNFGADEIGGEGLTATPIRTVALWSGVVETDASGRAVVTLPAPDFNGELRLMAVAWTDQAVGSTDETLTVREPVVAELALPRFLAPGDRALATLELHNLEGAPGLYRVAIDGLKGVAAEIRRALNLTRGARSVERVELAAPTAPGVGAVRFATTGPGFAQTREFPLQTRFGWGAETRVITEAQRPGEAWTPPASVLANFAPGSASLQVSYSPFRGFDPAPVAASLARYPYGCTEQIVSSAYPWLYVTTQTADARRSQRAHPLLSEAVGRLLDRQSADGAFGLWRAGDGEADPWVGAFATDFLIEAKRAGAPVSQEALDKALNAMRQIGRPQGWAPVAYRLEYPGWWLSSEEASREATARMRSRASAYALYVLAKGEKGDLARLRWYHDVQFRTERSPLARAHVAAGLALMGDRARAASAFRQAEQALGFRDTADWYQSPLRDLSAVIALAHEAGFAETAKRLERRLDDAVKDPDRLNTQEQARLLQAAHFALRAAGPVRVEATGATPLLASGGGARFSVGRLAEARFVNRSAGTLWRSVTVRGQPASAPGSASNGLSVDKRWFTLQGAAADASSAAQGDRYVVRITGRTTGDRSVPLVVDDALPAGFEIETLLTPEDAQGVFRFLGELSPADAQESRDDRFVATLDLEGGKPFTVAYVVRAVAPGDYYRPGVEVRDMYRPGVFARTEGGRVSIAPR